MITPQEAFQRYVRAKRIASDKLLEMLTGAEQDLLKVVDAMEMMALWRLALSSTTHFNQITLQQMLDHTTKPRGKDPS